MTRYARSNNNRLKCISSLEGTFYINGVVLDITTTTRLHKSSNDNTRWQLPMTGTIKCNIDAALFNDQHNFGVGMFIRNYQEKFVKAKTMWFLRTPPQVEACALKEGSSQEWLLN
ncbi:hypothetical protein A2U01_0002761 [Trifolium medium]|uniref:Uncharacterized protein n=1 Tax=Trifolium medium TaxID=97028 RepID=A0A392M3M0_9FABA|nr:hypothetical protein [Trifolium medium]